MPTSKDQLFEKIDHLLIDINAKYLELKSIENIDKAELTLLSGSIDYLSSHIKALRYIKDEEFSYDDSPVRAVSAEPAPVENTAAVEETAFTPETDFQEKEIDTQKTFEEIVEEPQDISEEIEELSFEQEEDTTIEEENEEAIAEPDTDNFAKISFEAPQETAPVSTTIVEEEKVIPIEDEPKEEEQQEVTLEEVAAHIEQQTEQEAPSRPLSINELIQQQKMAGKNFTQQFQTSTSSSDKVLDIKTAISLNDKLLFIKDLFNGYSLAYSEAIELLNRFDNFAEADAFLQSNYALKNGWADKPQTVEKLYAVLRKKFH
ncbi:hypothetical protein G5B00_17450 [Parapedobacter sp. SGR-10]|uniref:hypothetical protein n=1 Tax=Parapedobacter sp. SGR-10 TaxID=2710879 RepID=UPI0013D2F018|nr:hypothetical protein [Parapedobacter sp. SGR-10]NGF58292.1 hypothetical protein [Parapedobacter sp. SGR-10]